MTVQRGEIYFVDLNPVQGRPQARFGIVRGCHQPPAVGRHGRGRHQR